MHFHGLVKFGELDFLEKNDGVLQCVRTRLDLFRCSLVLFTWFMCHQSSVVQTACLENTDLPPGPIKRTIRIVTQEEFSGQAWLLEDQIDQQENGERIRFQVIILSWMATRRKKEEFRQEPDLPDLEDLTLANTLDHPLEDALVEKLDLSARRTSSLIAKRCLFRELSFAGGEIGSIHLRDVRFEKCDFSNSVLLGFEATRVEFRDCRLLGMRALECRWTSALLEDCDARYAQLNDGQLKTCEFRGSQLADCDLRGSVLEGALFAQTSLERADLSGAKLERADLRGANIEGITLQPEDLRGAIVTPLQAMDLARFLGVTIR
jgi:uncharacterized protein YjbI with pentapeptide repeats